MFSSLFGLINGLFLFIFTSIYKVIHSPFISYVLIGCLSVYVVKFFFNLIKSLSGKKQKKITLKTLFLYSCFIFVSLYSCWFICIHFHTFRLL